MRPLPTLYGFPKVVRLGFDKRPENQGLLLSLTHGKDVPPSFNSPHENLARISPFFLPQFNQKWRKKKKKKKIGENLILSWGPS